MINRKLRTGVLAFAALTAMLVLALASVEHTNESSEQTAGLVDSTSRTGAQQSAQPGGNVEDKPQDASRPPTSPADGPELVDDVSVLLEALRQYVVERNNEFARVVAEEIRQKHAGQLSIVRDRLLAVTRGDEPNISRGMRFVYAGYIAIALPSNELVGLIDHLNQAWNSKSLSEDRLNAWNRVKAMPIWNEFREALTSVDSLYSGVLGFCIADAADQGDTGRLNALLTLCLDSSLSAIAKGETLLPDPWLSDVVYRLSIKRRSYNATALQAANTFWQTIASSSSVSERLRYQAALLIQTTPESFSSLLVSLQEAKTEFAAGSLLGKYLKDKTLTQEELLLLLASMRGTKYGSAATVVLSIAFANAASMQDPAVLQRFGVDALALTSDSTLSDQDVAQLCGALQAAYVQMNRISIGSPSAPLKRELYFRHAGSFVTDRVLALIERLRLGPNLKPAEVRIMAWEVAQMIIELDEPASFKIATMEQLVEVLGGSRDGISNTVLRTLLLAQTRQQEGFPEYCAALVDLFLRKRGVQDHINTSPNSDQNATLDLVCILVEYHTSYPDLLLADGAKSGLVRLIEDVETLIEKDPNRYGAVAAKNAIDELESSNLLR